MKIHVIRNRGLVLIMTENDLNATYWRNKGPKGPKLYDSAQACFSFSCAILVVPVGVLDLGESSITTVVYLSDRQSRGYYR